MSVSSCCLIAGLLALTMLPAALLAAPRELPAELARIVFLGSSTTDGNSYPSLFAQALQEAGYPAPVCINAGAGGHTTAQIAARLDRDALAYQPTLVVLQAGGNDAAGGVTVQAFQATVDAFVARLKEQNIPLLLFTTNVRGPKLAGQEPLLRQYNDYLRGLAAAPLCRVADVYAVQEAARAAGTLVTEKDDLHPNFAGHRLITRALLDALGFTEVAVPEVLRIARFPGIIEHWRLHPSPDNIAALTPDIVKGLTPGDDWLAYDLPEETPLENWWLDCERRRGFALSVKERVGKAKRYLAIASLQQEAPATVYFNLGADVRTLWLNGERIYQSGAEYRGWHAGRERLEVTLPAGANSLLLETGGQFFFSITADHNW